MKTIYKHILFLLIISISSGAFAQQKAPQKNYISGNIIVRMLPHEHPLTVCKTLPQRYNLHVAKVLSQHSDIWLLKFNPQETTVQEVQKELLQNQSVLYAQPNHIIHMRAAPNDPKFIQQWQHQKINAEAAWNITTGGKTEGGTDIVVALMESADLINHEDLHGNQWVNTAEIPNNGIDDDNNGYVDDYNGWNVSTNTDAIGAGSHGTSCAGMIGAVGNNGIGVSGINWNIKIMSIAGYGSPFTESNIVAAYNYALQARLLWNQSHGAKGAFVVATSASWGVDGGNPNDYPIWCSFYNDLGQAGILNVGATTNQHKDVDTFGDVPTACSSDYMIGVTATDQGDEIDFAGWGKNTIELAAPGSAIYTTKPNDTYGSISGTSFACPLTAGLIGLMYSIPCDELENRALADPEGTAIIVKQALLDGVDVIPNLVPLLITGGRINAKKSLDTLMAMVCNTCAPPFNVQTDSIGEETTSISYADSNATADFTIYLQKDGDTTWQSFTTADTSFVFNNLTKCTNYNYYVVSACGTDTNSISSSTLSFRTEGCKNCLAFTYCSSKGTSASPVFTVTAPSSVAGDYTFVPSSSLGADINSTYAYGELVLAVDGTGDVNDGCSAYTNSTAMNGNIAVIKRGGCSFAQKVFQAQSAGAIAAIVVNNVAGAPFDMSGNDNSITIPTAMISQTGGNTLIDAINNGEHPMAIFGTRHDWIDSLAIEWNSVASGDNNGYYFDDSGIDLTLGAVHHFTLTPGFSAQALPEYARIWIDLNQDGVFDANELVYDQGQATIGNITGQFTVPSSAPLGSSRMRVQMVDNNGTTTNLPSVCGNFASGEVEDYCVTIQDNAAVSNEGKIKGDEIKIYPNPSATDLTLTQKGNRIHQVLIYTPTGRLLKRIDFQQKTIHLSTQDWANGIYFFKVVDETGQTAEMKRVSIVH